MTRLRGLVSEHLSAIYLTFYCYFAESSLLCYSTNHRVADAPTVVRCLLLSIEFIK